MDIAGGRHQSILSLLALAAVATSCNDIASYDCQPTMTSIVATVLDATSRANLASTASVIVRVGGTVTDSLAASADGNFYVVRGPGTFDVTARAQGHVPKQMNGVVVKPSSCGTTATLPLEFALERNP